MSEELAVVEGDVKREREREAVEDRRRLGEARASVLLVEDDPENRALLMELLASWGYEGVPVGSAEEGELVARRRPFLAAVVDVFLPGQSGASLIARLRERFPEALLIAISGQGDSTMSRHCKVVGADLFIEKPFRAEELAEALQAHHQTWH